MTAKNSSKLTQDNLLHLLSLRTGSTKEQARFFLESFVSIIGDQLSSGNEVPIRNLGSFFMRDVRGGTVKTPLGEVIQYAPSKTPVCHLSSTFRKFVKPTK